MEGKIKKLLDEVFELIKETEGHSIYAVYSDGQGQKTIVHGDSEGLGIAIVHSLKSDKQIKYLFETAISYLNSNVKGGQTEDEPEEVTETEEE